MNEWMPISQVRKLRLRKGNNSELTFSTYQAYCFVYFSGQSYEVDTINSFILQIRILRLREIKSQLTSTFLSLIQKLKRNWAQK